MTSSNSKILTEFIVKEIKKQQYIIERDSIEVTELAKLVASHINKIIYYSKNIDINCIIDPSFSKIFNKLNEVSVAQEKINNRKQLICDYQNQLYLINGYYDGGWMI